MKTAKAKSVKLTANKKVTKPKKVKVTHSESNMNLALEVANRINQNQAVKIMDLRDKVEGQAIALEAHYDDIIRKSVEIAKLSKQLKEAQHKIDHQDKLILANNSSFDNILKDNTRLENLVAEEQKSLRHTNEHIRQLQILLERIPKWIRRFYS